MAGYIDNEILETVIASLVDQYTKRRNADTDSREYLPSKKTINKLLIEF